MIPWIVLWNWCLVAMANKISSFFFLVRACRNYSLPNSACFFRHSLHWYIHSFIHTDFTCLFWRPPVYVIATFCRLFGTGNRDDVAVSTRAESTSSDHIPNWLTVECTILSPVQAVRPQKATWILPALNTDSAVQLPSAKSDKKLSFLKQKIGFYFYF